MYYNLFCDFLFHYHLKSKDAQQEYSKTTEKQEYSKTTEKYCREEQVTQKKIRVSCYARE